MILQKSVGELIKYVDERNKDGQIIKFYGININKEFMPTVANVDNVDATKIRWLKKIVLCLVVCRQEEIKQYE